MSNTATFNPSIKGLRDQFGTAWEVRNGASILTSRATLAEAKADFMAIKGSTSEEEALEALYGRDEYIEDEDSEVAYAQMLERRSEQGSWWGYGD